MRSFPRLLLVPALLLALFSCKKEVLVPVIERGADVAIPQEGGTYSVPVTYQATKAVEYGSFRYRLNIEHQLGPLMEVTGKVEEIVFEVPANETYATRTVRLAVETEGFWKTVFYGIQAAKEKYRPPVDGEWQSAADAVRAMRVGWNLGNTLDSCGDWIVQYTERKTSDFETAWGQPVTKPEVMQAFAAAGFGAIRVPVTWYQHMDASGQVEKAWMDRVEEVVNYVLDAGLYCVLNVHHDTGTDGWMKADKAIYEATADRFRGLWTQIAERFKTSGEKLVFEGYNELLDGSNYWNAPKDESSYEYANKYNQDFVDAVRATGGNNLHRNLVCNTYCAGGGAANLAGFVLPEDEWSNHLIAEVHSYAPYFFAFQIDNPAQDQTVFDAAAENTVKYDISVVGNHFGSLGIPCIIGEYGAANKNNMAERCKQAACYVSTAKTYGIVCFHWMGLMDGPDRSTCTWTEPALRDAILGAVL